MKTVKFEFTFAEQKEINSAYKANSKTLGGVRAILLSEAIELPKELENILRASKKHQSVYKYMQKNAPKHWKSGTYSVWSMLGYLRNDYDKILNAVQRAEKDATAKAA